MVNGSETLGVKKVSQLISVTKGKQQLCNNTCSLAECGNKFGLADCPYLIHFNAICMIPLHHLHVVVDRRHNLQS